MPSSRPAGEPGGAVLLAESILTVRLEGGALMTHGEES